MQAGRLLEREQETLTVSFWQTSLTEVIEIDPRDWDYEGNFDVGDSPNELLGLFWRDGDDTLI